jgi:CMP-N-acetylneuraminic acid synthetase
MFCKTKMRVGFNPFFYVVDFPEHLDIDTEEDWNLCQHLREEVDG